MTTSRRRLISIAGTAAGVAVLATAWILFAPTQLGGRTAYTMVVGTSMEPRLHRGDLVLVRRAGDYRVGDVVAYHSRALGRDVLHRIVARRGDGYVLKGDANDFVDPGPIRGADLIGRYSLRIGGGASVLQWLRTPAHAALVTGLVALLLLGTGAGAVERRRRGARRRIAAPAWILRGSAAQWDAVAAWSAIALLAFAALGIVVFSRPGTRPVPVADVFSHHGRFAYGASAPRGPAYPDGRVRSGDAVFTQLVHALRVRFDWRLGTTHPHAVHGTAAFDAVVSDGAGWERRLTLARPRAFRGDRVSVAGVLRLAGIRTLLERFQAETGTNGGAYEVRLEPRVAVAGVVDGRSVDDVFAPTLPLTLDQQRLRVASSPGGAQADGLARSRSVGGTVQAPNHLSVLGLGVPPAAARLFAVLGALASLVVLAAALARRRETGPRASVTIPQGVRTVRVLDEPPAERTVEVASPDELVRIAERYDRLVLECEPTATFLVQDDGVTYRWRGGRASGPAERRDHSTRPWAGAGEDDSSVERRAAQES